MVHTSDTPAWSWLLPLAALLLFAIAQAADFGSDFAADPIGLLIAVLIPPLLIGAIFAAVYHAEEVAHFTGEPVGTLVLTIAVTVIELALIVSLIAGGKATPTLVRDTVFATVMIITTGVAGACIFIGGLRYREQSFDVTSAKIYLAMLIVLSTLTLILPNYTSSAPGGLFSQSQLIFISVATIALYAVFLLTQTILHRDYFTGERADSQDAGDRDIQRVVKPAVLLCVALAAVVLLAKLFALIMGVGIDAIGAPPGVTGVIVALIVLMPEAIAAVLAARRDELQKSLNLALGSSLATIGLTVPAMAAAEIWLQSPLVLGLEPRDTTMLVMTLAASILTFGTGRTNVLFGALHLVLFGTFLFLAFVP